MPRFLVPVDFSAVSVNAALYAVQMAEKMPKKEVILYNVTEEVHAGADGTPIDFDGGAVVERNLRSLETLQVNLFEMGLSPMDILAEIGELPERIKPIIDKHAIDMVVMGTTGTTSLGTYFGENALEISRDNNCPVMIVPPEATFKGSGKVALAVELKDSEKAVALGPLKKWLDVLQPELHFVYVGNGHKSSLTESQKAEKDKIMTKFSEYNTHFHFLEGPNFPQALNNFVDANGIDHIVIFPKKHKLWESLFAGNHTKKLAHHSHVPVLTVHD